MQLAGGLQGQESYDNVVLDTIDEIENLCKLSPIEFIRSSKKPIRNIKKDSYFYNSIGLMFTKIANLSGLKGEISDINKQDISDLILDFNQSLSLDEIYFAFKLERYGQYENKTKHYEFFGSDYVSEILNKYRKWKQKTKVKFHIQDIKKIPPMKELTEEDKIGIVQKGVDRMYEDFKRTKEVPVGCVYIYDFLRKNNIIKAPTDSYRKEIKNKALKTIKHVNNFSDLMSVISRNHGKKHKEIEIDNECKRLSLIDFFTKKMNNENNKKTKIKEYGIIYNS